MGTNIPDSKNETQTMPPNLKSKQTADEKTVTNLTREEVEKITSQEAQETSQNILQKIGTSIVISPLILEHFTDIAENEKTDFRQAIKRLKEEIDVRKVASLSNTDVSKNATTNDPNTDAIITSLAKGINSNIDNLPAGVVFDILTKKKPCITKTANDKLIYLSPLDPTKDGLMSDMSGYQLTPGGLVPVIIKISKPDGDSESEIATLGEKNKEKIVFTDNKDVIIMKNLSMI